MSASWRPCVSLTKWTGVSPAASHINDYFYEEVFLVLKVQVGIQVESISSHGEQRVWRMELEGPRYRSVHRLGNVYVLVILNLYLILYVSVYSISPEGSLFLNYYYLQLNGLYEIVHLKL